MKLSENFTLDEVVRSDYAIRNGIDNTPSAIHILNLQALCHNTLEPLRTIIKRPIFVLSGYRNEVVNAGIGGAKNSRHMTGQAVDIVAPNMSVDELFDIASKFVPYDQAIHEFARWLHISFDVSKNRKQLLWAVKENGKTTYKTERPAGTEIA